ncbi:MAG: radical SAM protein [Candidatus Diapherotrites archaeon]|nr:radical SAM protein [Candidatus Diapherotrites archaeon]
MVKGLEHYKAILQGKVRPRYLEAKASGLLEEKVKEAERILLSCEFCERKCKVNRLAGEKGFCKCDAKSRVFGAHAHFGEEPELVPSATIFFAGCTMRCVYCQNAPESIAPFLGNFWSENEIAEWIELMHKRGCKNVNFVGGDPTPYTYNILKALSYCSAPLPVIWNSNAYYSEKTAKLLQRIVDVYLLDFRYFNNKCALKYSNASNYVEVAKRNFQLAAKDAELLVRVLVMPSHIECCAKPILRWLAENLGSNVRINIMDQYWPAFNAYKFPEMNRRLSHEEFAGVLDYAKEIGLKNLV